MEKTHHAARAAGGPTSRRQAKSEENSPPATPTSPHSPAGAGFGCPGAPASSSRPGPRVLGTPLPSLANCMRPGAGAPSPLPLPTRNRNWPVGGTRAMASGHNQIRGRRDEAATLSGPTASWLPRSSPGPEAQGAGAPHSRAAARPAAPPPRAPSPPRRGVAPPSSLAPPPPGVAARGRQTAPHSFQGLQRQQ